MVATKLHIITHHAEPPSLARIVHVSCRCGNVDRLVATRLQLYSLISHHAERPSLTRTVLVSCRCGDVSSTWSLPSFIMLRGPPRIGIPHLVATKFDYYAAAFARAFGIPHLVATKFSVASGRQNITQARTSKNDEDVADAEGALQSLNRYRQIAAGEAHVPMHAAAAGARLLNANVDVHRCCRIANDEAQVLLMLLRRCCCG